MLQLQLQPQTEERLRRILAQYSDLELFAQNIIAYQIAELKKAIEMRCYFSVNPLMLKSKKGRDLASRIPSELVLPESDGPFATLNGKPIMPWEAMDVCFVLSDIWNVSRNEAEHMILNNCKKIIDI